ncbi:MAG: hypothetical protein HY927_01260 [Elusimicrobia bacterium]|nr:hypothetical protein [Elusimicrobiota bacterium]
MSHREQFDHHAGCDCPEDSSSDVEAMVRVWQESFEHAAHDLRVEVLKQKMRKAWGSRMDPIADAVIALMNCEWKAAHGKGDSKQREKLFKDLVDKIRAAYDKGPK